MPDVQIIVHAHTRSHLLWIAMYAPLLGGSQMLTRFSTRFSSRFSQWESIDTFKWENRIENRPHFLTWPKTGYENRFKWIYIENRTCSLIELRSGSQSSPHHLLVPLVLLLTWDCYSSPVCYYFLSHTAITFLPLLFFSLYYYYFFPIALILFLLLLLFSHFVWWSHLIIKTDFN